MSPALSIIIPNWNGRDFLDRCVGAILQSAVESNLSFECILIDDHSNDNSAEECAKKFSQIILLKQPRNSGFAHTINTAMNAASGDIAVLVNNDLIAKSNFVQAIALPFQDTPDLFSVSGKTITWDTGRPNHLNMRGRFHNGNLTLTWSDDSSLTETMFFQGGSVALRRNVFLQLGGFNALFYPAYWEDYDLSYLALKAGYTNLYQPAAEGSHLGQGSMIRAYGKDAVDFLRERNRFVFLALNLTNKYHDQFWSNLPHYVCRSTTPRFKQRWAILQYLIRNRKAILAERQRRAKFFVLSDEEIFSRFQHLGTPC